MPIGIVLIFWALLLAVVATPVALALLAAAGGSGGTPRLKRVFAWMLVATPIAACYGGGAFAAYAVWCSLARGADPGVGDWFGVPLGNGFSLTFIDVSDHASIYPRGSADGLPLISDITQIGQTGSHVYGITHTNSAFVLNTETGVVGRHPDSDLAGVLRKAGVPGDAPLRRVHDFYVDRRWGCLDLAAVYVVLMPAILIAGWSLRRAWIEPARFRP